MIINNLEVLYVITVLIVASYYDIKYKKTPHYFWKSSIIFSVPIIAAMFFFYGTWYICFWCIVLFITVALSCLLFSFTEFGGADAKCLIFISLLTPTFPSILESSFISFSLLLYQPLLFLPILVIGIASLIGFCFVLPAFIVTRKKVILPFIPFLLTSYVLILLVV